VEGFSLLKNSLYARFGPKSGPKHTVLGAIWTFWSPMRSHFHLSADFSNRLSFLGSPHRFSADSQPALIQRC
jgi:hypothetical protein